MGILLTMANNLAFPSNMPAFPVNNTNAFIQNYLQRQQQLQNQNNTSQPQPNPNLQSNPTMPLPNPALENERP